MILELRFNKWYFPIAVVFSLECSGTAPHWDYMADLFSVRVKKSDLSFQVQIKILFFFYLNIFKYK